MRLAYLADPNSVHARRWMGWFARHGHDVHLLLGTPVEILPGLEETIHVHRYERFRPFRLPVVSSLQGRRALRKALDRLAPDVVHAHYLIGYGWQARLAGRHPYAVTGWGSDLFVTPYRSRRAAWWNRATLVSADLVTVNSAFMGRAAVAAGARAQTVHEIQFGVDTERFRPGTPDFGLLRRLGLEECVDRRMVLSVRMLAPLYRHEVVVDALPHLPDDVTLVASRRNADAAYLDGLRRRIEERGVAERVRFVDDLDEEAMLALLRMASATVSVPTSDGLPVTVLEAMATGCIPVVGDLPPLRELLGEVPELILPAADASTLATALNRILALDAAACTELERRLREIAVTRYDHDTNMRRVEALYAGLTKH